MSNFKPLLASPAPDDLSKLTFPLLASPKLDGIRCVNLDGKALTRNLKPVPNKFVREWIEANLPKNIDGELTLRDPTAPFAEVTSAIMSRDGEPDFVFRAFDILAYDIRTGKIDLRTADIPFVERLARLEFWQEEVANSLDRLEVVHHEHCADVADLNICVSVYARQGYEGTMVRSPSGIYKFGRSTVKEGILLKIKAFHDEEATVVGVVEQMHNGNEATLDALGHTERSTAKAGLVATGKLGALKCRLADGTEFEVGTGFTDVQRRQLWLRATCNAALDGLGAQLIGQLVKFKHQPPPGGRPAGVAPRFPVFLGFRDESDT